MVRYTHKTKTKHFTKEKKIMKKILTTMAMAAVLTASTMTAATFAQTDMAYNEAQTNITRNEKENKIWFKGNDTLRDSKILILRVNNTMKRGIMYKIFV